ncbi:MAG: AI-2E family transporter [Hyphomicrobiales bacterium]
MTIQRQLWFWAISFIAFFMLVWLLRDVLLPFVAGLVLAYFLDPIADWLESHKMPRLAATALIIGVFVLLFVLILVLVVPVLGDQIGNFAERLPEFARTLTALFKQVVPESIQQLFETDDGRLSGPLSDIAGKAAGWAASMLKSLWSGGMALVNTLALLVVTPIVAFYMLNDWDRMIAKIDSWLPRDHRDTIRELAADIDRAMAGFIRGQGTVCLTLGIFYAVALSMVDLNFGLLIGLGAGILSFIPYVGAILGGVFSIGTALVQFWPDWIMVAAVAGIFALGQFLEGNFLSPKLVGSSVGLHPVWLMFALFAFGLLFGFVGMLIAVPLAAALGVLVRYALKRYLESPLYLGTSTNKGDAGETKNSSGGA